jgi:restriction system protein
MDVMAALLAALLILTVALAVFWPLAIAHDRAVAQRRYDRWYSQSGMAAIDKMRGIDFENYVAARLRNGGFTVSTTPVTGDYGVDLIAKRGAECIAVQCKRYGKPVGVTAVQQVVAGALHYQCTSSMVVSNQEFTRAATVLAAEHRCRLVGRSKLVTPAW